MINIRADKEFSMDFQINIEGSEQTPQVRFVFEMSNGVNISFPGHYQKANDKVRVSLPSLNSIGLFEETENVNAKLEVIVEDSYFAPWQDVISIKHPMQVTAEAVESGEHQLQETAASVKNAPEIHYKEENEEKFSPVERLKKVRGGDEPIISEEIINGVLHRKIKK